MSSRETILNAVALNKPLPEKLPLINDEEMILYDDPCLQFINVMTKSGGQVIYTNSKVQLLEEMRSNKAKGNLTIDLTKEVTSRPDQSHKKCTMEHLHTCYLRSYVGIAENGAMWIDERYTGSRRLPFICKHLVIVLHPDNIVSNMHQAYRRIDFAESGFGVFIAGPSKTADIEQNLVIGAHGPISLTVYLIEN